MKPNIFEIATKELSQDAFITWLLMYADDACEKTEPNLNKCAKLFVTELIKKQFQDFKEQVYSVKAGRQWENIDVWAEVDNKYFILIEDKTYTSYHSNQLVRYKEIAEQRCREKKHETPICIYLKTGNESQRSLNEVQKQEFFIFSRREFLNLLNTFPEIENNIFVDFREKLARIEKANFEFENKNIGEWQGTDWQGFFQFLEQEMGIVNWNFVNNPNGGFWCAGLSWDNWKSYPAYVQLEQGKLCFKISTHAGDIGPVENLKRGEIRNELYDLITTKAREVGLENIRKPDRFGSGNYMTVAIVDEKNWLGDKNEKIDKEAVKKTLTDYVKFLKETISEVQKNTL